MHSVQLRSTHFPLYLHFSPLLSSFSATSSSMATMTSALLVRRLRMGNEPASGPMAVSNGVEVGHLTSPVSLNEGQLD